MSYGATVADAVHQAGIYAGKILSGAKAADLPVIEPTRFEFVTTSRPPRRLAAALHMSPIGGAPRRRESSVEEEFHTESCRLIW